MKQHLITRWAPKTEQTYVLPLDADFDPFVDHTNLFTLKSKSMTFLGGEPHFQITTDGSMIVPGSSLVITQRYTVISDLFKIILAADAARRMGFGSISLILPYFPAARQDRVCNEGEPLTIKIFADMINACKFDSAHILCPHSEVTPALIDNVVVHDELMFAEAIILARFKIGDTVNIVCPDAGAGKRVGKIAAHLASVFPEINFELIRCEKIRDVRDGKLKEFFVQADDLGGHECVIFDDIVALGGTFLGLATKLKALNAGELSIFTAHADCAAGIENLKNVFNVYTTNSKESYAEFEEDAKVRILPFTVETR